MNLILKKPQLISTLIALHAAVLLIALGLLIKNKGNPAPSNEKIVIIPVEGVISFENPTISRGRSVEELVDSINKLAEDDDVKAVVLRINSPGGSIGAVQEIHRALKKLKAKGKPIVSSFADVAASGGYYIACAGDRIIANPGTLTGSIGVIMQLPNVTGLLKKIGVSFETVKSGAMKDSGSPFRLMSTEERQYFQELIKNAYGQFFEAVKIGRKIKERDLLPLADGRVFSGQMALKNKLVDSLGGLDDAIEEAKKLSGLSGKKPTLVYEREKRSLERLLRMISRSPLEKIEGLAPSTLTLLYMMQ